MHIDDENLKIKVNFPKKKHHDNLLATANITINTYELGYFTIKGYTIWKSQYIHPKFQEYISIKPPSQRMIGKYIPFVFTEKPEDWDDLQQRIYDAYHLANSDNTKGTHNENVNPDEIPI